MSLAWWGAWPCPRNSRSHGSTETFLFPQQWCCCWNTQFCVNLAVGSRSSYHILYCVCVVSCLDWRTVLGQTGLLEGEGGVVRCALIPLWEKRKCNEGCEQLTRAEEQDCCFFPNWNCLCRYFRYGLAREKRKREDLLCSQCLRNKLVIFLKLAWGLLHKAGSCCSQNMCFLASERNNIKNKMSEKVHECEGGFAVASPKEGSTEGSGKLHVAGQDEYGLMIPKPVRKVHQ